MAITLTPALRAEYQGLFDSLAVGAGKDDDVDAIVDKLVQNRARYQAVAEPLGAPWQFVAVIHELEASRRFDRHLHNGDRLTARTVRVPAGRPKAGNPPFTWEESATDALKLKDVHRWTDWSIPGTLFKLEQFNGFGYRKRNPVIHTPYLWSFCQHYTRGKFVADGEFSATAVSAQCGAAVLLFRLVQRGHPVVVAPPPPPPPWEARFDAVRFAPQQVVPLAKELQQWLNRHHRTGLEEDGRAGRNTSDAVKQVRGTLLAGDPRG